MLKLLLLLSFYIFYASAIISPQEIIKLNRIFLQKYQTINPIVLLIDDTPYNQKEAENFVSNIQKLDPNIPDFQFMLFNASGTSSILENIPTKNNETVSNSLGLDNVSTSAVFFAILKAAQVLPRRSGILVFMERAIEDESLAQHAFLEISKKQIQVSVIWGGGSDEVLLKELAERSNGAYYIAPRDLSQMHYERFLEKVKSLNSISLLLQRLNLIGENIVSFPIDSDLTGIHMRLSPQPSKALLTTPNGYQIDLLNDESVSLASEGSFARREDGCEIHLNTTTLGVGVWTLRLNKARAPFNLTIFGHTKITAEAILEDTDGERIVKLGVNGDFSTIKSVDFVGINGKVITPEVQHRKNITKESYLTEDDIELDKNKQINITLDRIPQEPFYAVVKGKDVKGNDFTRLSYVGNNVQKEFYLPPITVELGLGSELITQPFRNPQILYEVTNNGNAPVLVKFYCTDEKRLLWRLTPLIKWISPRETATVTLTLTTGPGSYRDFITFRAVGPEVITKKAIVDVGLHEHDNRDPRLDYTFTSHCGGLLGRSCEDGIWAVEVRAKDSDSGLFEVTSRPRGLVFPNSYTAGTREEVTGYYSESCCSPDLKLIAYDRQNNRRIVELNAYYGRLSPGAIAAIVLGIILLLLLIIIAILLYRRKWSLKKGKYDLPVYRGPFSSRTVT